MGKELGVIVLIVKIQKEGSPIAHVFFSAFSVSIKENGGIIVWATDTDNKSYKEDFKPSSYQIIVEKEDDAKKFYKKHM